MFFSIFAACLGVFGVAAIARDSYVTVPSNGTRTEHPSRLAECCGWVFMGGGAVVALPGILPIGDGLLGWGPTASYLLAGLCGAIGGALALRRERLLGAATGLVAVLTGLLLVSTAWIGLDGQPIARPLICTGVVLPIWLAYAGLVHLTDRERCSGPATS